MAGCDNIAQATEVLIIPFLDLGIRLGQHGTDDLHIKGCMAC